MRLPALTIILSATLLSAPAHAGINLGMKLACKRYGDAWKSGSKSALRGQVSGDFGAVWDRVPSDVWAKLPRSGGGKVLNSSKGGNSGTVTVSTSQGVLTFVLAGQGFNWTVVDIHKAGDDGRMVSVKNYMDATLTAGEFMYDLKNVGADSFHDSISSDFRTSFKSLDSDELMRIRNFLPPINRGVKPYVQMNGNTATMRVPMPKRNASHHPNDHVVFQLVRENGWRVHDYAINSNAVEIPSFRDALPTLAAVMAFGDYTHNPELNDPAEFTTNGVLREALVYAKTEKPFPLKPHGERLKLVIEKDHRTVRIAYADRNVRIITADVEGSRRVDRIEVAAGDSWNDVGKLLVLKQRLSRLAMTFAIAGSVPNGDPVAPASTIASAGALSTTPATTDIADAVKSEPVAESMVATETVTAKPSVVETVSATETVPAAPVAETVVAAEPVAVPSVTYAAQPVETQVISQQVQTVTYRQYYQSKPTRRMQKRAVRFGRW